MTTPAPLADERLLTVKELQAYLRERGMVISLNRIGEQITAGTLPGHKVGGRYVIPMPALRAWMECKAEPEPEPRPLPTDISKFLHRKAS